MGILCSAGIASEHKVNKNENSPPKELELNGLLWPERLVSQSGQAGFSGLFSVGYDEDDGDFTSNPIRMFIPSACQKPIGFRIDTAGTSAAFHSSITGKASNMAITTMMATNMTRIVRSPRELYRCILSSF